MSTVRLASIWALAGVIVCAASARAADISTAKLLIKDNSDSSKRVVMLLSKDTGVLFTDNDSPAQNGAALHLYSATDDFCLVLPGGAGWVGKPKANPATWVYKNAATKTSALVKNSKLLFKVKSGVTFSLLDNGTQGTVDAQVQFGTGTRYCMRCSAPSKDQSKVFLAKNCAAAACDPEPSSCVPGAATTTTTVAGATTSTTLGGGGVTIKGSLPATHGRFNYNSTIGLPAANAACTSNFPGSHPCTYPELQSLPASALMGLKDTTNMAVTSFWAIDGSQPQLQQCQDDIVGGSGLDWEYATAHTASRGEKVTLDNATGTLGALQMSVQCNFESDWVGCCQ